MKFLTYGYDSCGLGHLRRTLQIGRHLAELLPDSAVLSVIGSTFGQNFFSASSVNHDFIKLPSAAKVDADQYEARHLPIPYSELIELRRSILGEVVANFTPDVVIIDKNPKGLGGEIAPVLERLRAERPDARIILSLRDVLDDESAVRPQWEDPEMIRWIDSIYDAVWIWGEQDLFDAVESYGFPESIRNKTRYLGYLPVEPRVLDTEALRQGAGVKREGERMLLMAAGGGGDALPIFEQALEGLRLADTPKVKTLLVAGPLMPEPDFVHLEGLVAEMRGAVRLRRFVSHFEDWIRASDAVVCMAGYNTMREVASLGKPAFVIPRRRVRREQVIRAELFASRGWCECAEEGESVPNRVKDFCRRLADGELSHSLVTLPCRGLHSVLSELQSLHAGGALCADPVE